ALHITPLGKRLQERIELVLRLRRCAQEPNSPHPLLRARSPRQYRSTAKACNEFPPPHSITSSARTSKFAGISSLRALAVLRLINSSNLVGNSTGNSAGL